MTLADSRTFSRVVVIAPRTRVDLALPIDVPVVDLLPLLLDLVGERRDDGGGQHGGWKLARVGGDELPSDRTLRSLEILDGTALHLTPRESARSAPIYDDVVDAIAATVRRRMSARSSNPAVGAAAAAAGLAVSAVTLLYRGHDTVNTYLAVATALVALGLGAAIARGPGERVIAATVAAGGLPFAFIAGLDIVPGTLGRSGVLLGFALGLAYSIIAVSTLGTGTVVFTATTVICLFGAGTALVSTAFHVVPVHAVAGTCAVGVAAIALLPWFVVRLARLPLPFIPTSASELRANSDDLDVADISLRARLADEYLNGTLIGCAATIVFSSAVVALHASVMSILLGAVCVVALTLRTRSMVGLVPRAAILAIAVGGTSLAAIVAVLQNVHRATPGLFAAGLVIALFALLVSVAVPRMRLAPGTIRAVDFLESVAVIAILPLAVGVMNLYSTMRHL